MRRRWRRAGVAVLLALVALALLAGGFALWLTHRWQPEPLPRAPWFRGVEYRRLVMQQPRPVVAHVVWIDLKAPGIDFVVTPHAPSPAGDVRSQPTSAFAAQHGVQLAINASYFYPFRNDHPFDYEPHPGDPVRVVGTTASSGVRYGQPLAGEATMYIARDRRASFAAPRGELWNAVSGLGYVVKDGARAELQEDTFTDIPYPRTIVALDQPEATLIWLVVDGKQPGYSEGLTLVEAADVLLELGAYTALQLDGGGSTTLVRQDASNEVEVISTPANFRVPGWERSVATHLGVRASRRD